MLTSGTHQPFKIEKAINFFLIYTCILTGAHRSTFSIFDIITRTIVRGFGVFKKKKQVELQKSISKGLGNSFKDIQFLYMIYKKNIEGFM